MGIERKLDKKYLQRSRMKYLPALLLLAFSSVVLSEFAQVKYLGGITFLLKDGCPENSTQRAVYQQCAATEVLHTQCVTDRLKTGDKLTVPVYTDICSAVCWGENIGKIHDCPFNGKRLDGKGSAGSDTVDKALADKFLG